MNFNIFFRIFIVLVLTPVVLNKVNDVLIRKKRYLVFPEGASMTIAFCLTSQTWVYPPTIFTQNLAWAMAYNLPNETTAFKPYFGSKYVQHRRNRRDLYGKMEQIMNSMGYNGRSCILKALCEVKHRFLPENNNLLQLILKIVFRYPKEAVLPSEPEVHRIYHWASQTGINEDDCWIAFPDCPFSIIDLVMGYYSEDVS